MKKKHEDVPAAFSYSVYCSLNLFSYPFCVLSVHTSHTRAHKPWGAVNTPVCGFALSGPCRAARPAHAPSLGERRTSGLYPQPISALHPFKQVQGAFLAQHSKHLNLKSPFPRPRCGLDERAGPSLYSIGF